MLARISSQGDQQRTKHEQVLDKACEMTQRLWGFDEDEDMRDASAPCTNGHIASYTPPVSQSAGSSAQFKICFFLLQETGGLLPPRSPRDSSGWGSGGGGAAPFSPLSFSFLSSGTYLFYR